MEQSPKWHQRAPRYRRRAAARAMAATKRGAVPQNAPTGSTGYIWRIDPRDISITRMDHRKLNGKRFAWDDPPVHNVRTGERGHPGVDRQCRCFAEPVFD